MFHTDGEAETYTTREYTYDQVQLDVREQQYITFSVRACKDISVALFADFGDSSSILYRVHIGGWDAEASVIRRSTVPDAPNLVKVTHPPIISCESFRTFWVSWADGLIQMGYGRTVGLDTLMQWREVEELPTVKRASLVSGHKEYDILAEWEVHGEYNVTSDIVRINVVLSDE